MALMVNPPAELFMHGLQTRLPQECWFWKDYATASIWSAQRPSNLHVFITQYEAVTTWASASYTVLTFPSVVGSTRLHDSGPE